MAPRKPPADELGAHVSNAGGVHNAPARAAQLSSIVLQLFTKMASRWAEPVITPEIAEQFKSEVRAHGIVFTAAHDSYLINLGTSDALLFERSCASFRSELERCNVLGLDALVTHPGNATGGDVPRALAQNAAAIEAAMHAVPGHTRVLFETTAGSGTALGAKLEELGELIRRMDPGLSPRLGVCIDTCHVWAAGYDLVNEYDDFFRRFDDLVGLERIGLFHLNDSVGGLASRRDRHAHIGQGALGPEPFRRLLNDERFRHVPKVIETPKDDDVLAADLANLARLRGYRQKARPSPKKRANKSESA